MKKIECFKIRLLECGGEQVWDLGAHKPIHDILCDHSPLSLNPVTIVADPFLFVDGDRLFLFYEEKRNYTPGVIRMTSTVDLIHWTKAVTVLKEDFHLSYPFVFEDQGSIYMIPETSDVGDIRLYMADNKDLTSFSLYKTLLQKEVKETEIGFADTSVFKKDNLYFLMTSVERQRTNYLYLYFAFQADGPYVEHSCSPVCASSKYGRNGGGILAFDDKLFRVAQDCEVRYGDNIHMFEIDKLNTSSYEEHLALSDLIPNGIHFYKEGGHQLHYTKFKGKTIVATDAKEYQSLAFCRGIHKFGQILLKL